MGELPLGQPVLAFGGAEKPVAELGDSRPYVLAHTTPPTVVAGIEPTFKGPECLFRTDKFYPPSLAPAAFAYDKFVLFIHISSNRGSWVIC